ncbi:MAG TPA: FG-GAP-like repeat-containing protein, partial [Bryobacteraceae bacterium]|nr:FG-GAP-like repeat-containing protein [Bryobacteraceae bacterium]
EVGGESSCSWRVDNSSPWIRFRLDASASNGDILFGARVDLTLSPQPFGAGPRVGVILADNQPVTVYQKGTPVCTYSVSGPTYTANPLVRCVDIGSCPLAASISVVTNPQSCNWTASKPSDAFGASFNVARTGNGAISFDAGNYSNARIGSVVHFTGVNWSYDLPLFLDGLQCNNTTIHVAGPADPIPYTGGSATISVTAPKGCPWSVSTPNWLSIQPSSGSGSGNLVISAPVYGGPIQRSGAVTVAGQMVTIKQDPPGNCTSTSVTPNGIMIPAAGGSATVTVTASPAGCTWNVSGAPGFTVTAASGSATITATSANNTPQARPVIVVIAGKNVNVTQSGISCGSVQLTTPGQIPQTGGTVTIQVTIPAGCPWTAPQSGTWFHISPTSGTGLGSISVIANSANTAHTVLLGSVSVGSQTVNLSQARWAETLRTVDFDGDGHADPMVWRPSNGTWYLSPSTGSCPGHFAPVSYVSGITNCMRQFGLPGDIPLAADFDGDGRKDLGLWRPAASTFFLETTSGACPANWLSTKNIDGIPMCTRQLPVEAATPIAGDFDGDGHADVAFFRPSDGRWIVWPSSGSVPAEFNENVSGTVAFMRQFGIAGDRPAPGDYDNDGITDVAVYRPSNPGVMILLPSSGSCPAHWSQVDPTPDQHKVCIRVAGDSDDWPVAADYDGDGTTDQALFRSQDQVWTVFPSRSAAPGILSNPGFTAESQPYSSRQWGLPNDIPAPADFDGDQKADLTVFRPAEGKWYVFPSTGVCPLRIPRNGTTPDGRSVCVVQWGLPGDIPLP